MTALEEIRRADSLARKYAGTTLTEFVRRYARSVSGPTLTGSGWPRSAAAELVELARYFDAEAERMGISARAWRGVQP